MRLFIAVEFEESLKNKIFEIQQQLIATKSDVKWVGRDNFHITLKFIGEVSEDKLDGIISGIKKAITGHKEIKISISKIGVFPDLRNPRVIWLGADKDSAELSLLAENIEKEFSKIGLPESNKKFNSHLTLGRIRSRKGIEDLMDKIKSFETIPAGETRIRQIVLMKSILMPSGPVYSIVESFGL